MDRQYIRDQQIIERYLRGSLTAEEEQAFEEAYLGDQELLDELQAAERLAEGLGHLERRGTLERTRPRWLSMMLGPQFAAAASVLLLVSLVFSGVLYRENARLRETFALQPAVTRLVPLVTVRGGAPNELTAPAPDEWTVLVLDPGVQDYDSYRAVLERRTNGGTEEVLTFARLAPAYDGSIAMGLPGRLLSPGEYAARLEGRMDDWPPERFAEISRTPFVVTAQ